MNQKGYQPTDKLDTSNPPNNMSKSVIPTDAHSLEVFSIKTNDAGEKEAFIGYKISNDNFYFVAVPFTEPETIDTKLLKEAIDKWGNESQIDMKI